MTKEDIIRMALKCGASIKTDCEGNGIYGDGINVEQFANLIAEAVRERIAKQFDSGVVNVRARGRNDG